MIVEEVLFMLVAASWVAQMPLVVELSHVHLLLNTSTFTRPVALHLAL